MEVLIRQLADAMLFLQEPQRGLPSTVEVEEIGAEQWSRLMAGGLLSEKHCAAQAL
jgi:hypothetical protein